MDSALQSLDSQGATGHNRHSNHYHNNLNNNSNNNVNNNSNSGIGSNHAFHFNFPTGAGSLNDSQPLQPGGGFSFGSSSNFFNTASPVVSKWTPPGSPNRTKLRSEYQLRLRSPAKKRMSLELASNGGDSYKRCSSPIPVRRTASDEIYSDRFIPSRSGSQMDIAYSLMESNHSHNNSHKSSQNNSNSPQTNAPVNPSLASAGSGESTKEGQSILNLLLKSELLGVDCFSPRQPESKSSEADRSSFTSPSQNLFKFKSARQSYVDDVSKSFSLSPVGTSSRRLLSTPRKAKRKIPKVPFKVLDAPALQDDFYLNLVDWSSLNVLAVGLGSCVYLWSACTSKVTKLCDLGPEDCVTSVSWTQRGTHLAVGTNLGEVQIWEASRCKKIRTMAGHSARIGTMSWNAQVLASGSRDRLILLRDVRIREPYVSKLQGHKQEVCGLRWSFDDNQLASGGNDNKLCIWNLHSTCPVQRFNEHTAAVKAIAWSPHQHGLLASGGGTADRCIRFWNTLTGGSLNCIDTGSQVCNLMWSKNINEIVSTHGYSLNQIIVWRYPSMTKVATLTGHTYRVLYLAMSPDGQTIVTGAGDETLRFWNAFPGPKSNDGSRLGTSLLFPAGAEIRDSLFDEPSWELARCTVRYGQKRAE